MAMADKSNKLKARRPRGLEAAMRAHADDYSKPVRPGRLDKGHKAGRIGAGLRPRRRPQA